MAVKERGVKALGPAHWRALRHREERLQKKEALKRLVQRIGVRRDTMRNGCKRKRRESDPAKDRRHYEDIGFLL